MLSCEGNRKQIGPVLGMIDVVRLELHASRHCSTFSLFCKCFPLPFLIHEKDTVPTNVLHWKMDYITDICVKNKFVFVWMCRTCHFVLHFKISDITVWGGGKISNSKFINETLLTSNVFQSRFWFCLFSTKYVSTER